MAALGKKVKMEIKKEPLENREKLLIGETRLPTESTEAMETDVGDELEDGEISSDEDDAGPLAEIEQTLFDGGETQKDENSKRFMLYGDLTLAVPKQELQDLYDSLGIGQDNERHYRFNTVHLRGTDKMKSEDVFDYFSGLEPAHVDWLDDGICNVQWEDEILPARALLYLSLQIVNTGKRRLKTERRSQQSDSDSDSEEVEVATDGNIVDASKLPFPLPPGKWRKGESCEKSKRIIMRYANKDDRKVMGVPLREHSIRHHSHRHGKRAKHKEVHVDEGHRNPWGPLAQTWGRGEGTDRIIFHAAPERNQPDLRRSLNDIIDARFADSYLRRAAELHRRRLPSPPVFVDSSSSDSDDDGELRRKLPKMQADIEEERINRARLETAVKNKDLRSRINHKVTKPSTRLIQLKQHAEISDESGDDLNWAEEGYSDLKMTLDNRGQDRDQDQDRDSLESDSEFELGLDEPGEMLQIEVDNEYCKER